VVEHDFLGRMVEGEPAFLIYPREACAPLVRALEGGYRYPWTGGEPGKTPPDDNAAALVRALLLGLAVPEIAMSEAARTRIMGPRGLRPGPERAATNVPGGGGHVERQPHTSLQ
jgi:hypothetical protein